MKTDREILDVLLKAISDADDQVARTGWVEMLADDLADALLPTVKRLIAGDS